jgi:hypothetical protein
VEKTYGEGLPRDRDRLIFADDQYPFWPLTPEQKPYAAAFPPKAGSGALTGIQSLSR